MADDLTQLFNKFVGQELKNPNRLTCDLDETYAQIKQLADENCLSLRVWFAKTVGTMDMRANRLNVHGTPTQNGGLVIERFNIG